MFVFIIQLVVILAFAGALGYLAKDYGANKKRVDKKLEDTTNLITDEKTERVHKMTKVVGDVNMVNDSIYKDYTSKIDHVSLNVGKVTDSIDAMVRVKSAPDSTSVLPFIHLPVYPNADVELMHHITALSGMTIKGLTSLKGDMTIKGLTSLKGGSNMTYNSGLLPTEFPGTDSKNHIRGDTRIYGDTYNLGNLSVDKNISVNQGGFELNRVDTANNPTHKWKQQQSATNDFSIWEYAADSTGQMCSSSTVSKDGAVCGPALTIQSRGDITTDRSFKIVAADSTTKTSMNSNGDLTATGTVQFKGARNTGNQDTYFNGVNNKNYIRGDTDLEGKVSVNGQVCLGTTCLTADEFKKLKELVTPTTTTTTTTPATATAAPSATTPPAIPSLNV